VGELGTFACPVRAVRGAHDEYGTLEQVRGIQRRLPKTRLLVLPKCGHSPHRDEPERLIREAGAFIVDRS
jgi:pimeloyl-ACP methyl ester carboxylesterase